MTKRVLEKVKPKLNAGHLPKGSEQRKDIPVSGREEYVQALLAKIVEQRVGR